MRLVEGTSYERAADTYAQAGDLLARFHGQHAVQDDGEFEQRQKQETLGWLSRPHRIAPETAAVLAELRTELADSTRRRCADSWRLDAAQLARGRRTHRRHRLRTSGSPAAQTDLARLAARQFRADPSLEGAFFAGYGSDPREPGTWLRLRIREAVGTAAWAFKVGDEAFEEHGHRMIADILMELE